MNAELFPASYSKLSLYEKCPLQAKFRYIDKIPYEKNEKAQRGTDLHGSIEGFLKGEKRTLHKDAMSLVQVIKKAKANDPFVEHKVALAEGLRRVVEWDSRDAYFRLVIDSAYIYGAGVHVQEWKSGRIYPDHADQRRTYAMGAERQWPAALEYIVTTYYMDQGKKQTLRVDKAGATLLGGALMERLQAMGREKHFAPRPGDYCRWCPYSRYKGGPCRVG